VTGDRPDDVVPPRAGDRRGQRAALAGSVPALVVALGWCAGRAPRGACPMLMQVVSPEEQEASARMWARCAGGPQTGAAPMARYAPAGKGLS
jgi:hypothetical protein